MHESKVKRAVVKHVWIGEAAYKYSRWILLYQTVRLTKSAASQALKERNALGEYYKVRVRKFRREDSQP